MQLNRLWLRSRFLRKARNVSREAPPRVMARSSGQFSHRSLQGRRTILPLLDRNDAFTEGNEDNEEKGERANHAAHRYNRVHQTVSPSGSISHFTLALVRPSFPSFACVQLNR